MLYMYVKNHGHTLYTAIQNLVGIFVVVLFFEMNYYFSSATMQGLVHFQI